MMSTLLKLLLIYVYSLTSAAYVWAYVRRVSVAGWTRLIAALPVVVGNLALPLILDPQAEPLLITPAAGCMSLAAFKILAFSIGRGPLMLDFTFTQFMAVLLLPIIPYEAFFVSGGKRIPDSQGGAARDTWTLLADYGKQIGCASVVALVLAAYPDMHWFPRHWLYTLSSCMFLGGVFDVLGALATSMFNVSVAPTFNRPWMSDCFADFWSRRWNLTTTYMMRVLVYEPVMDAMPSAVKGKKSAMLLARLLALQATFMFSGVWHILIFWCNTHVISLRWAMFFIIQAPIVLVESLLSKAWRRAGLPTLPHALRVVLTNAALIAVAGPLFFGPADDTGFAQRNLATVKPVLEHLKALVPSSLTSLSPSQYLLGLVHPADSTAAAEWYGATAATSAAAPAFIGNYCSIHDGPSTGSMCAITQS